MKTPGQEIEDLAKLLASEEGRAWHNLHSTERAVFSNRAKKYLEVAKHDRYLWPTEETVLSLYLSLYPRVPTLDLDTEVFRSKAKEAMLKDPIIKAAIELKNEGLNGVAFNKLIGAVKDAGL